MKNSCYLLLTLAALLVAGCGTPAKVDHGSVRAATFSFIDGGSKAAPGFVDNREQIHANIQDAITRNLASKGLSRVASGGDVTVAYLVIAGNNGSTEAINTYRTSASMAPRTYPSAGRHASTRARGPRPSTGRARPLP